MLYLLFPDHKKLPFMAMLRNLRNMIKAGISDKHHSWVLKKLTDQGSVIYSRQFPFRFFSAYEVLTTLDKEYEENRESQSIIFWTVPALVLCKALTLYRDI